MSPSTLLVFNCGSSSVKFAIFNQQQQTPLCHGQASEVPSGKGQLTLTHNGDTESRPLQQNHHRGAVEQILQRLEQTHLLPEVIAVGHRVVHGGAGAQDALSIDTDVRALIEDCTDYAPLHNPVNLAGIDAVARQFPHLPQVAVFDTAFHSQLPAVARYYAVPKQWRKDWGVQRYGFHGINHHYIAQRMATVLEQPGEQQRVISAHLGNGCSVCAIKGGRSLDTSMGFTPLEGLVMGTRCGDLDPGLMEYLCQKLNLDITGLTDQLNHNAGLQGISGHSSDMQALLRASDQGDEDATLAIELFCYRLAKYIAAYFVPLGGLDALVFTGGIGEHASAIRERTLRWLAPLGLCLDPRRNHQPGATPACISAPDSIPVYVVPANEEWMIARQCFELLNATQDQEKPT